MGISFFEDMHGYLTDAWGVRHAVDFSLKAAASDLRNFLLTGSTLATGIIHAPTWVDTAPVRGTLNISLFRRREITYELHFEDGEGRPFTLRGRKALRLRSPLRSATRMAVSLVNGGAVLAHGEMRFDKNDLGAFLRSMAPVDGIRRVDLAAPLPDGSLGCSALTKNEEEVLRKLALAMLSPGEHVPAPDEETVRRALVQVHEMPPHMRSIVRVAITAFNQGARLDGGRAFLALSDEARGELVRRLAHGAGPENLRRLVGLLGLPIKTAHFSRPEYLRGVGTPEHRAPLPEKKPGYMSLVNTPEELERVTEIEAEVIVVGTGAGGAALAAKLAERGVAVALVEEGRYKRRQDFGGPPVERMRRLWRDRGVTISLGKPPISIPLGRLVGGTTTINSGTCFRTPDAVLEGWREELGFPDDFAPRALAPRFDEVEAELGVGPSESNYLGGVAQVVAAGADAMGLEHGPLPRNAPGCDGQGVCIFGCPTGAKRSTDVSYVPRALRAGAHLFTGMPVTRILMRGRRAIGIEARGTTEAGEPRQLRIRAEHVVLSCGALMTPLLLQANGFRLPHLGKNLSVHPAIGLGVLADGIMDPWTAVPQGYGVRGYEQEGIIFEGVYVPPELLVAMVPLVGEELMRWMDLQRNIGQFGLMVKDEGVGSVRRALDGRPVVRYDLTEESARRLQKGTAILAELLLRGGGKEVLPGIAGQSSIRTVAEARRLRTARVDPIDLRLLGAHPLGTCRMGASSETAVVDFEHRVFGTANLYVVDGSTVPTSLGVNPQVTIMAMATRAAEILSAEI